MDDLHAWIAFSQLSCFSLSQKHALLNQFGCVRTILELNTGDLNAKHAISKQASQTPKLADSTLFSRIDQKNLEKTINWMSARPANQIISYADKRYPFLLKQISLPPLILYATGDAQLLESKQISIVGSRKATLAGKQIADRFAQQLCAYGLTVTSGMALGIDTYAHKGALCTSGRTIAVLGTGIDRCYPASNIQLYEQIAEIGLLISEFNLAAPPQKTHFPQRNRIISGLSIGTLVVEAAQRSGSLITARYALQQNREVFAIPGSILSNTASGCLGLIQQGAKLVRNIDDILNEFSEFSAMTFNNTPTTLARDHSSLSPEHKQILELITDVPFSFDKLFSQSGLTIDQLCSILLELELDGLVEKLPGNQYLRTTR